MVGTLQMVILLALLTFNPILQLNHVPPKLPRLDKVPAIPCSKVDPIVIVDSPKQLLNNWIPAFSYRCVPGSPFHSV